VASEPEIGAVALETREFKTKQGNVSIERWAWLTEPQATFVMTLSRNTEQALNCKLALSVAFEKAKRVIKEVIPNQAQEIERLKLKIELAHARESAARSEDAAARSQEQLIQTTSAIATLHGSGIVALILGKPDAIKSLKHLLTGDRTIQSGESTVLKSATYTWGAIQRCQIGTFRYRCLHFVRASFTLYP
jgi:hypothetical protein